MTGRVYDDGPDRDTVDAVLHDEWLADSRRELEAHAVADFGRRSVAVGLCHGAQEIEPDDFARRMWGQS